MELQGFIYRGRKPVHWSHSSRTALAEAELEYPGGACFKKHICHVQISQSSPTSGGLLNEYFPYVCLAIWTTTPWTIPANADKVFGLATMTRHVYDVAAQHVVSGVARD